MRFVGAYEFRKIHITKNMPYKFIKLRFWKKYKNTSNSSISTIILKLYLSLFLYYFTF